MGMGYRDGVWGWAREMRYGDGIWGLGRDREMRDGYKLEIDTGLRMNMEKRWNGHEMG